MKFTRCIFSAMGLLCLMTLSSAAGESANQLPADEAVNLALRRTADKLLRISGDSTVRIRPVKKISAHKWQVQLDNSFEYDSLPAILQASLNQFGITGSYQVAIRDCYTLQIDLGYRQADFTDDGQVPCQGREAGLSCQILEVSFDKPSIVIKEGNILIPVFIITFFGAIAGFWVIRRKKSVPLHENKMADWLSFGNSKLDVNGQMVAAGQVMQPLTFRETKLLHLFVTHPDRLLDRTFILENVWADEGILVGRSIDVFVSRLRKKLLTDPSVAIAAVHGVGYRLETNKVRG